MSSESVSVPSYMYLSGLGQFSHALLYYLYDFYSVSPEYFGYIAS
jgi:hypothetical protein